MLALCNPWVTLDVARLRVKIYSLPFTLKQMFLIGYEWNDTYKMISIYIDTPAFDEVTKDRSYTFTDQLSTVRGTFGLLTGFSLISAVEILFFMAKFLMSLAKANKKKESTIKLM